MRIVVAATYTPAPGLWGYDVRSNEMSDDKTSPAIDLPADERAAIDHYHALRQDATHYDLLGLPVDADRRAVRDAYFALSKRFHPDVYFKREIGAYHEKIEGIFRALTRAYDALSNPRQRAAYDKLLSDEGVTSAPRPAPYPAPPPKITPPTGLREAAMAAQALAGSRSSSPSNPSVPVAPRAVIPEGAVIPPSLRTVLENPANSRTPTPHGVHAPVDESVRQRAMEAMARKLGGRRPATASSPPTSTGPTPQQLADERRSRAAGILTKAEEAQKAGDLATALEGYKSALQFQKDDATLLARIDAVTQLLKMQQVTDHIEKAKAAQKERQYEQAAAHWEKAWEGRREDPSLLLNAAEILARAKEHKRAAELAQRAIGVDPKLTRAHALLAAVFLEAGLKASARGSIENLARLDPNHAQLKELREKLGPLSIAEQFGLRGSR
jgi:tetratricopeptide (TPR) repeat protein